MDSLSLLRAVLSTSADSWLFNLLIFDEAHHAADNRPYNRVIRIEVDIEEIA